MWSKAAGHDGPHATVPGQVIREAKVRDRSVCRTDSMCACLYTHAGVYKTWVPCLCTYRLRETVRVHYARAWNTVNTQ